MVMLYDPPTAKILKLFSKILNGYNHMWMISNFFNSDTKKSAATEFYAFYVFTTTVLLQNLFVFCYWIIYEIDSRAKGRMDFKVDKWD